MYFIYVCIIILRIRFELLDLKLVSFLIKQMVLLTLIGLLNLNIGAKGKTYLPFMYKTEIVRENDQDVNRYW